MEWRRDRGQRARGSLGATVEAVSVSQISLGLWVDVVEQIDPAPDFWERYMLDTEPNAAVDPINSRD